ncbi:MAG: hypothetical protein P1U74_07760, partial [Legionellaceae bacterium]|nr:hypothetical protein [Legionellaceae bacterium]
ELSKDNSAESSNERFMYPTSGPTSDNSRHRRLPKPKPEPQLKLGEVNPQSSSDITNSLTDTDGDVLNNVVTEEETGRFFENMIIASGGIIMSISGYLAWLKTTCCTNTCSSNLFPESINRFFHNGYTTILNSEDNPLGAEEAVTNHGDIEIVVIDNIMHDRTDDGYIPDTSTTSGYQGV